MIRPSLLICLAFFLRLGASVDECDDNSTGWTLKDPEDCHGYYLCHSGHKLQQYCAPGMKYVHELGTCVVGKCPPCDCADIPITYPTEATTTTIEYSTISTTDRTTITEECSSTTEPTESSTNSTSTEFTAYPTEPTLNTDPTVSSTNSSVESTTIEPSTESTSNTDPTVSSTNSSTSSTTTSQSTTTSTTSVPHHPVSCENVRDGSFFSDPDHCRDYYVCRNGKPVLLHCEKGMWFDDVKFVCNFRYLVNCPANID